MTIKFGQCFRCKNVTPKIPAKGDGLTCKAFPNGIPEKLFSDAVPHTKPFPNDNGIMFEAK